MIFPRCMAENSRIPSSPGADAGCGIGRDSAGSARPLYKGAGGCKRVYSGLHMGWTLCLIVLRRFAWRRDEVIALHAASIDDSEVRRAVKRFYPAAGLDAR